MSQVRAPNFTETKKSWNKEIERSEKAIQENTSGDDQKFLLKKISNLKVTVNTFNGAPYRYPEIQSAIETLSKISVWCTRLGELKRDIAALDNTHVSALQIKAAAAQEKIKKYTARDEESDEIEAALAELNTGISNAKLSLYQGNSSAASTRLSEEPLLAPIARDKTPSGFSRFLSFFCCCTSAKEKTPLLEAGAGKGYKKI